MSETQRDFKADRAICDAATPGPWVDTSTSEEVGPIRSISEEDHAYSIICQDLEGDDREADRTFIAAAREGWPAALDEIDRLRIAAATVPLFPATPDVGGAKA
jgi:hypothetical protein